MSDSKLSLADQICKEPARPRVVAECVSLIDDEVKAKGGLSGIAIKGAYGTVKTIKPRFVTEVVDGLLDDWVGKLEPHYDRWRAGSTPTFAEFLTARSEDVAEDLLAVTDDRANKTKHSTARKMYMRMRGSAKANVVTAIPKLGRLLERHLQAAPAVAPAAPAAPAATP